MNLLWINRVSDSNSKGIKFRKSSNYNHVDREQSA